MRGSRQQTKSARNKVPGKSKQQKELDQIQEVIEYRIQGNSVSEIATEMKLPKERVTELLDKGLAALHRDTAKDALLLDLARVNTMLAQVLPEANAGAAQSMDMALKLMKERTALEEKLIPTQTITGFVGTINTGAKKNGRPAHTPTDRTKTMVEAFAILGTPQQTVAKHIGISVETLVKHYGAILEYGKQNFIAETVGQLASMIRRGKDSAVYFTLKTQAGWRETNIHELTGKDGQPLPAPVVSTPMDLPLVQFIFTGDAVPNEGMPAPAQHVNGNGAG